MKYKARLRRLAERQEWYDHHIDASGQPRPETFKTQGHVDRDGSKNYHRPGSLNK